MTEEQANAIANITGLEPYQSGGNIWVCRGYTYSVGQTPDGYIVMGAGGIDIYPDIEAYDRMDEPTGHIHWEP
jgi:hypothetical protein